MMTFRDLFELVNATSSSYCHRYQEPANAEEEKECALALCSCEAVRIYRRILRLLNIEFPFHGNFDYCPVNTTTTGCMEMASDLFCYIADNTLTVPGGKGLMCLKPLYILKKKADEDTCIKDIRQVLRDNWKKCHKACEKDPYSKNKWEWLGKWGMRDGSFPLFPPSAIADSQYTTPGVVGGVRKRGPVHIANLDESTA